MSPQAALYGRLYRAALTGSKRVQAERMRGYQTLACPEIAPPARTGKAVLSARSRNNGKTGEREPARLLRAEGFAASRGVQYHGGTDSPDVICPSLPAIHFEVKRTERLRLYEALAQATHDAKGKLPIVAHRANASPWVAILDLTNLLAILRASEYCENVEGT